MSDQTAPDSPLSREPSIGEATSEALAELAAIRAQIDELHGDLERVRRSRAAVFRRIFFPIVIARRSLRRRMRQRRKKRNLLAEYHRWIDRYDSPTPEELAALDEAVSSIEAPPSFSIIMPTYNTDPTYLREAVGSILVQRYANWELILSDDASTSEWMPELLDEVASLDPRIRVVHNATNGHISRSTNAGAAVANGDFLAYVDHDDLLHPEALARVALAIRAQPDVGMLYSDQDLIEDGVRHSPYFKPDFDPVLFLAQNYLSHFRVLRRDLVTQVGGCRVGYEGSQDWDLGLRVSELLERTQIVHVPHILYHWRVHPASASSSSDAKPYTVTSAQKALRDHLERRGQHAAVRSLGNTNLQRVVWDLGADVPSLSILVELRHGIGIPVFLQRLHQLTDYDDFSIELFDNTTGAENAEAISELPEQFPRLTLHRSERRLTSSQAFDVLAAKSSGQLLCLMNQDIEMRELRWVDEMLGLLKLPEVGIVGSKITDEKRRIEHAGYLVAFDGLVGTAFRRQSDVFDAYGGQTIVPRTVSAVSSALLMIRRELWDELGGFDQALPYELADVDLCLRAEALGRLSVITPYAGALRSHPLNAYPRPRAQAARLLADRWGPRLTRDPYYNPNLSDRSPSHRLRR